MPEKTIYRVGLENGIEGRSLAWVLGHPGCFAYGADGEAALANVPVAIRDYGDWIEEHGAERWIPEGGVEFELVETWEVYTIDEAYELVEQGYEIDAWFRHDWKPLTAEEVERGLKLLSWSRADLLEAVEGLSDAQLDARLPGQRWSIRGVLGHVGGAEWWYLDRLGGAFPRALVPQEPFERLRVVRAHLGDVLPELVGSRRVVGTDGEFWSPRKVLRRAAWHERDHAAHIGELREGRGGKG
jgi:hypothetical protein